MFVGPPPTVRVVAVRVLVAARRRVASRLFTLVVPAVRLGLTVMTLPVPERFTFMVAKPLKSATAMFPAPPAPLEPPTVKAPAAAVLVTLKAPRPLTASLVVVLLDALLPMVTLPFTVRDWLAPMVMVLALELLVCTVMAPPKVGLAADRSSVPVVAVVLVDPKTSVFVAAVRFWFAFNSSVPTSMVVAPP